MSSLGPFLCAQCRYSFPHLPEWHVPAWEKRSPSVYQSGTGWFCWHSDCSGRSGGPDHSRNCGPPPCLTSIQSGTALDPIVCPQGSCSLGLYVAPGWQAASHWEQWSQTPLRRQKNIGFIEPHSHKRHYPLSQSCSVKDFHLSHLADTLIQSDLQEQLTLSAFLKGTPADFSPCRLGDSNQQPFSYCPNALNQ